MIEISILSIQIMLLYLLIYAKKRDGKNFEGYSSFQVDLRIEWSF